MITVSWLGCPNSLSSAEEDAHWLIVRVGPDVGFILLSPFQQVILGDWRRPALAVATVGHHDSGSFTAAVVVSPC